MRIRHIPDDMQDAIEIKTYEYDWFALPLTQTIKANTRVLYIAKAMELAIHLRQLADAIEGVCGPDPKVTHI